MLEHTKKPITNAYVEFVFHIDASQLDRLRNTIIPLFPKKAESASPLPWKEVFPDFNPGLALRGARKREGLTQKELAGRAGVRQVHISKMENQKQPIGKEMAKQLAEVLKVDYRIFLS